MTDQSIGTARLDIVVDTTQMQAGVDAAVRKTREFDGVSSQSTKTQEQNSNRQVAALKRQVDTLGLTREEMVRYRIETQTTGKVQAELLTKLDAQTAKLKTNASAFNQFGLSAKQQAAALRGVPAQVTDIVTALASGQRPITVLLQQGGQLKDMFGGIVPAARALGSAVLGLINPFTVAAAAAVGLGLAWKTAAEESQALNLAIIQSGDYSRKSAADLELLAEKLDRTTGATQRFATDVAAQVVASGRFTGDQVEIVTTAIVNMATAVKAAGGDADETVKDLIKTFTDLSKDPVQALLKLNETQHFLERSTLDQVKALKEQGREADAVEIAIKAMADTLNDRAPEMVRNVNSATAVFADMKGVVAETADAIVGFFRNADSAAQNFVRNHQSAVQALAKLQTFPLLPFGGTQSKITQSLLDHSTRPLDPIMIGFNKPTVDSKAERDRIEAEKEFARLAETNLSKREKLEAEIKDIRELGAKAGKSELEIEKQIANARQRYLESLPKPKKPKKENTRGIENASDRFDDMVGRFQAELQGPLEKAEQEHIKRMREIQQAARDGKRSHEDLAAALALEGQAYKKTTDDIHARAEAEIASMSGPIAQAQAQHEAALARIEQLKTQGLAKGAQYTAMLQEEAKAYELDRIAAERAADPLGALLSDMGSELDLIGKSNAERAVMVELRRQNIDAMSAEGQAALATAKAFEEEAKAKQRSIDLMDEFRSGAADALTDFATGAKSAKEAILDFFDSLMERLIQMTAERWIEKAFGNFGTSDSGSTGFLANIASAIFGGSSGSSNFSSPFANGGAFAGGVQAFATGGVVGSPTFFPMRNGTGLMGEKGPEAIMPLARLPNGKLGVETTGSKRGDVIQHNTYTVMGSMDRRAREAARYDNARNLNRAQRRNG